MLKIRDHLMEIGVGRVGDYDHCVNLPGGIFRHSGANPFRRGDRQDPGNDRQSRNCKRELVNEAIQIIRRVHPYEEPLVNIIPLANHLFDLKSMSGQ
jgi:hypothetical protein